MRSQGHLQDHPAAEVGSPGPHQACLRDFGRATAIVPSPYPGTGVPRHVLVLRPLPSPPDVTSRARSRACAPRVIPLPVRPGRSGLAPPSCKPLGRVRRRGASGWPRGLRRSGSGAGISTRPCRPRTRLGPEALVSQGRPPTCTAAAEPCETNGPGPTPERACRSTGPPRPSRPRRTSGRGGRSWPGLASLAAAAGEEPLAVPGSAAPAIHRGRPPTIGV